MSDQLWALLLGLRASALGGAWGTRRELDARRATARVAG